MGSVVGPGSVRPQTRRFSVPNQKAQQGEARIQAVFRAANQDYSFFHPLGRVPTQFIVVNKNSAATVSSSKPMLQASKQAIVLRSNVANTTAEIIVR